MLMRKIITAIIAITFFWGCSRAMYLYKDDTYGSSEAALQAQRDDINQMIAEIKPTNNPLGAKALVVLPSKKLIERKALKITDSGLLVVDFPPPGSGAYGSARHDIMEHSITATEFNFDAKTEMLKRRKIFDEISVTKSDQPETVTSSDYNIVIYLKLMAPDQMQWYIRTSLTDKPFPIYSDQSLRGVQQNLSWLDYLEKTAAELLRRQKSEGK